MSTLKKRTRLAAVATATLSGASIFALATPAQAATRPEPITHLGSTATGGSNKTITVKFTGNAVNTTSYAAELFYYDATNSGIAPTGLPYFGGQTGMAPAQTTHVDGVNTITFENVPAGKYKVLVWANNAIGRSDSGANGVYNWNGGVVPENIVGDKFIEVTVLGENDRAPIPNYTAYRPYASWGDLLDREYMLWTGHNKKGAAIKPTTPGSRYPRDDEFTFWRYNLAVKDMPTSTSTTSQTIQTGRLVNGFGGIGIASGGVVLTDVVADLDNNGATPPVANVPNTITVTVAQRNWPRDDERYNYNLYYTQRLNWLISDPRPGWDASVPPKALSPHAPADTDNSGRLSRAEVLTAVRKAEDWAFNDVLFDRREFWAASMAEEAAQTDGPAIRLYTAYFGRTPDYGGLAFWSKRLRTGGSLLSISEFFLDSDEFKKKVGEYDTSGAEGKTDAAEFVALIYRNVLNRDPDGSGFAFWTRQLQTERYSPAEVLIGFSEAHEFRDRVHARTNAASVYAHLLGRVPTDKEYVLDDVYNHFFVDNPTGLWVGGDFPAPEFVVAGSYVSGYHRLIDTTEYAARAAAVPARVPARN